MSEIKSELEAWKAEREAMLAKRESNGWDTGSQLEHAARDRDDIRRIEKILGLGNEYPDGKMQRLQAAVHQLLHEVKAYQRQENERRIRKESLDTIETYGLKPSDMRAEPPLNMEFPTPRVALTYGVITPYRYSLLINGIPHERFIWKKEAVEAFEKSVKEHSYD